MAQDDSGSEVVPSVYAQLAARFTASDHKTKTIGGTGLTYVDGETVVSRLNEVLGFDGWSFEVVDVTVLEDEVWARGRLTVYTEKRAVIREQTGGQIINRTRGTPARPYVPAEGDRPEQPAVPAEKGKVIELSNDIKGAVTDCLKKCATLVGVGLYLYDPTERREVEAEMRAERGGRPAPKAPASTPAANPATTASRSASTPTASGAAPTSSSTAATTAPPTSGSVQASAVLTGAPERLQQRWERLVSEAERVKLPTIGTIKAIDPKAVSEAQLKAYADRLENRIYEVREAAGAA